MVSWGISPLPPKSHGIGKTEGAACEQGITAEKWSGFQREPIIHEIGKRVHGHEHQLSETGNRKIRRKYKMNVRNEIKAQIIRTGMTMQEVVDLLSDEYGWSDSVSNLSAKLQRESIRYREVLELADVLGYEIVWQKRRNS
jgi:hypothetical protein